MFQIKIALFRGGYFIAATNLDQLVMLPRCQGDLSFLNLYIRVQSFADDVKTRST